MDLYKHKIYCETDSKWEYLWAENDTLLTTCPTNAAHAITTGSASIDKIQKDNAVVLAESKNADNVVKFQPTKSYSDSSKSFTTPDYSSRQTWWFDTTQVTGEVLTDGGVHLVYTTTRTPTAGWDHDWVNWKRIPNNARQTIPGLKIKVYKNDVEETSGFTLDHTNGTVTFAAALEATDVVKADYSYANSSLFELIPEAGKKLKVDYVETQFSALCDSIPDGSYITFEAVYNGPAIPTMGIPLNTDVVIKSYEYHTAADFLNESTRAYVSEPFMELTKKQMVLPWDYLTGHTLKPPGDATTNLANNEFNKLRCKMVGEAIIPNCEIATGTFYCIVEDL